MTPIVPHHLLPNHYQAEKGIVVYITKLKDIRISYGGGYSYPLNGMTKRTRRSIPYDNKFFGDSDSAGADTCPDR
jgi:hypothetical protein